MWHLALTFDEYFRKFWYPHLQWFQRSTDNCGKIHVRIILGHPILANQYEAFPALSGPPHGRAGGQDRPVSGRAGHGSARQAGLGQRQTGQVRAGQGRKVLGRTGRRHEASAVGQCRTGLSRGGSRKTPRGGS